MTKSELIAALMRKHPHLQLKDINLIVNTVFGAISKSLADNNRVELRGFGAFSIKERDPRVGRNPKTGEQVQVSKKFIPFFKTGKELHARINKARES
ncbi:integration host factor subunit beta [Acetobacter tropicalis]|jgi:integration host factor subunit beta|uniref:Integration host factor subunit beta n=1 Tax=Acetobacter tropicalis TaxID=104102 RepID=A0A095B057_9PROT|nr:integration host factor subunit beta [Acetobacter tropicalis]KAA8390120.1 integration host factor subunit beta [Acetobacter tropicalis]KAA8391970.1 integration host factor subunit beta [Acetobacter tropicalis]KGB22363.1 Integration host factor beta subunit [Acetobacter tropicalis]KXV47568.1 integration host factor subunit beta [Acetobacter tropicalis]KXV56940.1 integration host factor subunit beta [Acetobacter tropicalis]